MVKASTARFDKLEMMMAQIMNDTPARSVSPTPIAKEKAAVSPNMPVGLFRDSAPSFQNNSNLVRRSEITVMKHLKDDDLEVKEKMNERWDELEDKKSNFEGLEQMNEDLLTKERQNNCEIQAARKELIMGLTNSLNVKTGIGIKKKGELDEIPFLNLLWRSIVPFTADFKHLGHLKADAIVVDEEELHSHKRLQDLNSSVKAAKHLQRNTNWGLEGFIATTTKVVEIVGSSNGLVCISPSDGAVFLHNPTTGDSKRLPETLPLKSRVHVRDNSQAYGFGFNNLIDDYKVVNLVVSSDDIVDASLCSLKTKFWEQICNLNYEHNDGFYTSGVHFNGASHRVFTETSHNQRVIIAFDLEIEEFGEIPLRNEAEDCPHSFKNLVVGNLNGRLYVVNSCYDVHDDIWVMKEYSEANSWNRIQISWKYRSMKPLCLTKNDGKVLRAILSNGYCYRGIDVMMNILHNSLAYLISSTGEGSNGNNEDQPETVFIELRQREEYSLVGVIYLLQQVTLHLNKGDAMWCLLMSECHVERVNTMDKPSSEKRDCDQLEGTGGRSTANGILIFTSGFHPMKNTSSGRQEISMMKLIVDVVLSTVKIVETFQCSVCLDDFEIGTEAKQMPCKHKFHGDCLLPWLERHSSWPVSRNQIPADEPKTETARTKTSVNGQLLELSLLDSKVLRYIIAHLEDKVSSKQDGIDKIDRLAMPWTFGA